MYTATGQSSSFPKRPIPLLPRVRTKNGKAGNRVPATQSNWQQRSVLRPQPHQTDLLERAQRIEDRVLEGMRRKNSKTAANRQFP